MGATITDVAKQAGLSTATVSKYLNHKKVSPRNCERIQQAIEQLDYQINDFARGLRTSTSMMIGLLVPGIGNIFTMSLIKEMEEMLIGMNYSMILCNYDNRSEKLIQKLTFMHQKKVDGVIFLSDEMISEPAKDLIKKMQTAGTSFVFVNGEVKGMEASTVLVDSINTIYESIVYLISHGHQRIGMICSPRSTWNAREREEGYRRVFLDYHMPVDEKRMFLYGDTKNAPDWQEDLKERSKDYLRANPDMTALILPGYRLTLIGLRAIHELCLKVGRDISVIGFDCGEISDVLDPALSYVSLPAEKMAKCAIDMLIHSIHHDALQPRIVRIKAQLITRDSVCSL